MHHYPQIISRFRKKKILVVGDLILDQYIRGKVSRISPEAPVPVVLQENKPEFFPGGAANVANNLSSLGAQVTLAGFIGDDEEGKILLRSLKLKKVSSRGIVVDRSTPTSMKTRIIAQHQQVVRVDREKVKDSASVNTYPKIEAFLRNNIQRFDALILSDYGKGVITPVLAQQACDMALKLGKIITVDPKVEHFCYYRGVSAITPNRNEVENAIHNIKITQSKGRSLKINTVRLKKDEHVDQAGMALLKYLDLGCLLVTLGENGMRLFEKGKKKSISINTRAQDVYDVSGAGDTVISVFTLSLAAGASARDAADLSNYAAGIVVGKMGAVPVTSKDLLQAVKS